MMAAIVARVGWATHNAVMLGFLLAFIAEWHPIRKEAKEQPFKASRVIGEHGVKVFLGETLHFGFAIHGDYLLSGKIMPESHTYCQGIITFANCYLHGTDSAH
jgi:hypothetical protein